MRSTDLRTAAARHFLGLSTTEYLLDVAHAALDSGIYARGLGEIITSHEPIFSDLGPFFDSALKELGIKVPSWDEAINRVAEGYMVAIAEGADTPQAITRDIYLDCMALQYDARGKRRDDSALGPLIQVQYHHYQYDDVYGGIDPEFIERADQDCIALAANWCREHWLPSFDPSWLTTTVVALARGIRAERAFDRLPILADALQDAGCDNADILDHCRGPGLHVRGCWVVDLVLGKS